MRPARALWIYLIFVFAGGAALAPLVHHGLAALADQSPFWARMANAPFRRIVDRCLLGLALVGLWPLVRALGARSSADIGWKCHPRMGRDLAIGILFGSALLLIAAAACIASGAVALAPLSAAAIQKQILNALVIAILVAPIEETLFRGAIYTSFRRVWKDDAALWISSALYAVLHFFARPENPAVIEWNSGFIVLGRMLRGFTEFHTLVPGFFSLTLLGVIFGLAYQKTGALYLSIGMHAALIFWVKMFGFVARENPGGNPWFWGTGKLVDGWFPFVLLAVAAFWFLRRRSPAAP